MMIQIDSNLDSVITHITAELESLDFDRMTREQATAVMGRMRTRIHENGKASNGSQIGTYSIGYLAVRSGAFGNSKRVSRGKNKGKLKDAGTYLRGGQKGSKRVKYNRGSNPTVILSLTRQMESDMVIKPIANGHGIGYSNSENFNKAKWNEKRYRKDIFSLSEDEEKVVMDIAERYINELDL